MFLFCVDFIKYVSKVLENVRNIWDKVFKNRPRQICGRQPLKKLKGQLTWSILEYFVPFVALQLTHLMPLVSFYIFWKHQKTLKWYYVTWNGLACREILEILEMAVRYPVYFICSWCAMLHEYFNFKFRWLIFNSLCNFTREISLEITICSDRTALPKFRKKCFLRPGSVPGFSLLLKILIHLE